MSPSSTGEDPPGRRRAGGTTRSGQPEAVAAAPGVLERLPRTRPQRPSARRAAARRTAAVEGNSRVDSASQAAGDVATQAAGDAAARTARAPAEGATAKPTAGGSRRRATQAGATPPGRQPRAAKAAADRTPRAAAKAAADRTPRAQATKAATDPPRAAQAATGRRLRRVKSPHPPPEPPAPPQGFEAEEQIEPGRPVQPPSGSEVATAVVELLGETAQAGLSAGGRLLRDTFRRLAGS